MKDTGKNISIRHWITLLFLSLIWGTSFILIKRALISLSPMQIASLRIGITFIAFIPLLVIHFKKFNLSDWYKYFFVGLTTTGIPSYCFSFAQKYIDSGTTGILNSLTPIFTFLVSIVVFRAKFEYSKLLGVIIGFFGAGFLVYGTNGNSGSENNSLIGFIIVLIATICYGFNSNLIKHYFPNTDAILVSIGAFTTVGIPVLGYFFTSEDIGDLMTNPDNYTSLGAVVVLSLACTLLANLYFYKLVQNTNPVFASTVTFIIPVVACGWALYDGEQLNIFHAIAVMCIVIALSILRKK